MKLECKKCDDKYCNFLDVNIDCTSCPEGSLRMICYYPNGNLCNVGRLS